MPASNLFPSLHRPIAVASLLGLLLIAADVRADVDDVPGGSGWVGLGIAILTTGTSIMGWFRERERRQRSDRERVELKRDLNEGMLAPVRLPPPAIRNSAIMIGLGGTGKTMLIRNLVGDKNANPERRTEDYALYHSETTNEGDRIRSHLFISDYRGQNIGTLFRAFIRQQKEPWSPMAYGFVDSLIVIVDLFDPPDDPDDAVESSERYDEVRVRAHLEQWRETALDSVFGLVTRDSLKYVCLFVNKCDLLIGSKHALRGDIETAFSPLRAELRRRTHAQNATFEMILGSAKEGMGLPQLAASLKQHSARIDRKEA